MNVRTKLYISLFSLVCNVYKHWVVGNLRNVVQNEFSQRALIRQSSCTLALYNNIYREIRKYPQCIIYSLPQKGLLYNGMPVSQYVKRMCMSYDF